MEWLNYLSTQPTMLNDLIQWLKQQEQACMDQVLDLSIEQFEGLKAKRATYQEIRAFIHNNTLPKGTNNGLLVKT